MRLQKNDLHHTSDEAFSAMTGAKRKSAPTEEISSGAEHMHETALPATTNNIRTGLASHVAGQLARTAEDDTIHECGQAALGVLDTQPDLVLALAYQKLHTWKYDKVPTCWRRLYEDASLYKAIEIISNPAEEPAVEEMGDPRKKRKPHLGIASGAFQPSDWLTQTVYVLDRGISLSGAPGRSALFHSIFLELEVVLSNDYTPKLPSSYPVPTIPTLKSSFQIPRLPSPPSFESFQQHLDKNRTPLIIPSLLASWPALTRWAQPAHLLSCTLNGRRLVPIEIGSDYLSPAWRQTLMPVKDFMKTYLLPPASIPGPPPSPVGEPEAAPSHPLSQPQPQPPGYLAQHDLLAQIPSLRTDISIPDYCYTSPPAPGPHDPASRTPGLASTPALDEPLINAWLGPAGTRTPLHTDPYHNILAQVVGYKYVRLHRPEERGRLYPLGKDERGVGLENTSAVDLGRVVNGLKQESGDDGERGERDDGDGLKDLEEKYPLFFEAEYQEAVLGPGDCIYIPLGWWHYVESLSTSFSVSFWWN